MAICGNIDTPFRLAVPTLLRGFDVQFRPRASRMNISADCRWSGATGSEQEIMGRYNWECAGDNVCRFLGIMGWKVEATGIPFVILNVL